jgi:hypothetical protein
MEHEAAVQHLVGLLEKSVEACRKKHEAERRLSAYVERIEKRVIKETPKEQALPIIKGVWNTIDASNEDDFEVVRINGNGHYEPGNVRWATKAEQMANPRLPDEVRIEFGRRLEAVWMASSKTTPIYDEILELLGLNWAFEDGQPGCATDPIDAEFLYSVDSGPVDPYTEVIAGYEDPFYTVDDSIGCGPATAEEAEKLIGLAGAVNAARAEYRKGKAAVAHV